MHLEALLPRASSNCITCPDPIPCNCAANQDCFQINRDCFSCSQTKCVARAVPPGASSAKGASKGALAGGIVGALIFLAGAVCLFLWYRRATRLRRGADQEAKKDIPAPAATVLNRPDPTEKPPPTAAETNTIRVYSSSSNTTIDLDPESQHSSSRGHFNGALLGIRPSNPFDDTNSIQTAVTEGTNVIPIALVAPDHHRAASPHSDSETTNSNFPTRPARSPDLNLNLEHVNVSQDTLRVGNPYASSQRSGVSGVSSRHSYMSNASYSSDFLNEAPMIITPTRGAVRQVLGVVKAEVISTPPTPHTTDSLKPPSVISRPSVGSPLAATSFGPSDILHESDEGQEATNPFSDAHSPVATTHGSPSPSVTTFGKIQNPHPQTGSSAQKWVPDGPNLPWAHDDLSRPSSMSTQDGSVADIGNVTRVNVALLNTPMTATSFSRTPQETAIRKVGSPGTPGTGTLEEQQQRALAHAQAQAHAQGLDDKNKRISNSSVLSAASTRADSILESFPFVPPSPISDRPARSPPVSPLGQQSFSAPPSSPLAQKSFTNHLSPANNVTTSSKAQVNAISDEELFTPPNRRTLGLSTGSQLSTASSGLGSFPFQIDTGSTADGSVAPPSAFNGRQRASLDTLAITSDLSSYPLGFDRDSALPKKS